MKTSQYVECKAGKPFSFEVLKTSADASLKIHTFQTLKLEDITAWMEVDCYFQKRLGCSVFSDMEYVAIQEALDRYGIEFLEIN